jgi:plasmid replication initiation protein
MSLAVVLTVLKGNLMVKGNLDFFVSFVSDFNGKTKELQDFMSHNWFSLKKGRTKSIEHYFGKDKSQYVKVYSAGGSTIATIWDNDFLLFAITQLRKQVEDGLDISNGQLTFSCYDYYTFRYRALRDLRGKSKDSFEKAKNLASGQHYKDLSNTLERLHNTHVKTNVKANGVTDETSFVFLPAINKRTRDSDGRVIGMKVQVANWLIRQVQNEKNLLTFEDSYFEIKGSLERWLFLFCRKSCGVQREWKESLISLHKKSASTLELRKFITSVKKIVAKGSILDYELSLSEDNKFLVIKRMKSYFISGSGEQKVKKRSGVAEKSILQLKDILQQNSLDFDKQ